MDKLLRQKFRDDFNLMRTLINEFDPCSFINGGAPDDEYDALTHKTLSHIYLGKTRDEIKRMIMSDLEFYYGCVDETAFQENREFERKFKTDFEVFLDKLETTYTDKNASR
ncbi:MAG: hypothetical protein V4635_09585 [Bacteroidota bacterium]